MVAFSRVVSSASSNHVKGDETGAAFAWGLRLLTANAMAKSTEERKTALLAKRAALDAQLQALKARESAAARKLDTRRKIVIGGAVMAHCAHDPDFADAVKKAMRSALTTERDKTLLADWIKILTKAG